MRAVRYFVVVFGDPNENGDPVESGQYSAGDGYAPFHVGPGDALLLYCTDGYTTYAKQIPGIGVASDSSETLINYCWIPFLKPLSREHVEQTFESADRKKMQELRFNTRRVFEISKKSFSKAVEDQPLIWREEH